MARVLDLTGIHNFRDYGDYAARNGARVASGKLYRSGQHRDGTADDLARVAGLGISTIIDLRGASERAGSPCPRAPGFAPRIIASDGDTTGIPPHLEASAMTAAGAQERMISVYRGMPFRPQLVDVFKGYFDSIVANDGATLIHCFAGKDRTGLAVAVLHHLLGVHADDIMADYLLTNTAGDTEARIAAGVSHVRGLYRDRGMSDDAVRTIMSVEPQYLDAAMAEIVAAHGDVATYAEAVLGVDAAKRAKIEAALLV